MNTPGARAVPLPIEEFTLHGHLAIRHSCVMSSTAKLEALIEAHDDDHAHPDHITHPHVHSDPEPEPEWSWE